MVLSAILTTFGSINDQVFIIGQKYGHKDTYSDGTTVIDGEKYALVWTTNGVEFAGFNSDGTLVDANSSKIVAFIPAKNGRLGPTLVQVSNDAYKNGTYSVSLLDTREKPSTGDGEFGIRNFCVLGSGFECNEQFGRMPIGTTDDYEHQIAIGYVEPPVTPTQTDAGNSSPNDQTLGQHSNSDVILGTYTNEVTITTERFVEFTNVVTRTIWRDAIRYTESTNYFNVVMTNSVDVTNMVVNTINSTNSVDVTRYVDVPIYKYVTITNYFDAVFGKVKKPIQTAITKKKSTYVALVIYGRKEVGTATIQIGKPNGYGLCKVSIKFKVGKKTYTDTLYGMIDDDRCMIAYGKELNDRLVFNGKDVDGFIQYKGVVYEIDGMFTK